uniref:Facilitated trehalose transporter Tret1 n=1 Tax=Cacopsylla melanoneura TaxID=428564 RepID=A0A8D8XVG1_9HEMI
MEPDAVPSTKGIIVQILCSLVACAAILSPGMNMGYSAFALKGMRSSLDLSTDQETWIASLSNLVTPIGCLLSGPILERYGRKCTLLLVAIPCSIGWFLMAIQPTLGRIYIGRILTGLATGLASTPGSVYAAECTLSTLRGYLMSGSTVFISLGILMVNVLGLLYKDNWQIVAGIGGVVSLLVAALTLVFLPESPVWLLSKGYESKAAAALKTLRGTSRTETIQKELATLLSNRRKAETIGGGEGVWRRLCRPEAYKPLIILNVFFLFQQLTGIYVAVSYTLDFVKDSGVTQDIGFIAVLLGALRLLVIFVGTCCSKTLGRRFTAIVSGVGMTPCLLLLAFDRYSSSHSSVHNNLPLFSSNSANISSYSLLNTSLSSTLVPLLNSTLTPLVNSTLPVSGTVAGQTSWVPVAAIVLYIVFSTFGFLIIPWSLLGEIYPAKSREVACGITACLAYLFNFAIVKCYPYMSRSIGSYGVFAFFGVMALIGTLFVIIFLPETQGKTLAEIEQYFIGSHPAHSRPEEEVSLNGGSKHNGHPKTPIVKPANPS